MEIIRMEIIRSREGKRGTTLAMPRRRFFSRGFAGLVMVGALGCAGAAPSEPVQRPKRAPLLSGLGVEAKHAPPPPAKVPPRADPTLLSRGLLFSNPDHSRVMLSPDGKRIA